MRKHKTLAERFWPKVEKGEGCWIWKGASLVTGYGSITLPYSPVLGRPRTHILAHRASWELAHGPIPPGMFVCHRCDNPPCVRPDHLFLGTQFENMGDCAAKMRHVVGNKHPHSKLNPDAVREIRRLRSEGLTQPQIAVRFGVAVITVCKVLKGYSWAHVK